MEDAIYQARNISKAFGPTVALDDVGFEVHKGSIVGLAGMNGAGKSTLLRIIAGAIRPDAGELILDGQSVSFDSTSDALHEGVAIVSQELSLFPSLSVEENLRIVRGRRTWESTAAFRQEAEQVLGELGFEYGLNDRVKTLSLAESQLVEIARALLQQPRVLILDEPTSSLHAAEVGRLHKQLRRLRDQGVGIVYVTHFLEDLIDVCDEAIVLRNGRRVEAPDLKQADPLPQVVAAMLGASEAADYEMSTGQGTNKPAASRSADIVPLEITDLKGEAGFCVDHLKVEPGEIYGLAGLLGSGVSKLFEALFGLTPAVSGTATLPSGMPLRTSPATAVDAGVSYMPADRKAIGLMQRQSICENVASVRTLAQGKDGFVPSQARLHDVAHRRCEELGVRMASVDQIVSTLSGGNQQKVVFAKWLEAAPSLLLLDDPTRGIDVHARREIHGIIKTLAATGKIILMYSSDPGEIVEIADRIGVFLDGKLIGELQGAEKTEHNVVVMMNSTKGSLQNQAVEQNKQTLAGGAR